MYLVQAEKLSNLKPLPFQDYVTVFVKAFYIQVCKSKQLCALLFYIRRLNSSNGLRITLNTRPLNCGRWCRFFRLFFCFCEGLCTLTLVSIGCYCFPCELQFFRGWRIQTAAARPSRSWIAWSMTCPWRSGGDQIFSQHKHRNCDISRNHGQSCFIKSNQHYKPTLLP